LAGRIREWASAQGVFTAADLYRAIGVTNDQEREVVYKALRDFRRRGEVILLPPDRRRADAGRVNRYRYNNAWRRKERGEIRPVICKAMYVSGTWSVSDIVRLTGLRRDWIDRVVNQLRASGHIIQVGRRLCAHGAGAERIYHIPDRGRFRLEVMR